MSTHLFSVTRKSYHLSVVMSTLPLPPPFSPAFFRNILNSDLLCWSPLLNFSTALTGSWTWGHGARGPCRRHRSEQSEPKRGCSWREGRTTFPDSSDRIIGSWPQVAISQRGWTVDTFKLNRIRRKIRFCWSVGKLSRNSFNEIKII
jgi:hypothetical protein